MSEEVYVVGVGMTPFGRFLDVSVKELVRQATTSALRDACIERDVIDAAFYGNASQGHMDGQHMIRGQVALRDMGIGGIPVVNVENACASGSSAFTLAVNHIRAGMGDIALAVGAEKMYSTDKARMFSVFDGAMDVSLGNAALAELTRQGEGIEIPPGSTSPRPYSIFMEVYAAMARAHMKRFGTTQRQIAAVSAKNHRHSVHNPLSQYQNAYTIDEVLAAAPITYPLTVPMCSPVSDGAAAVIVCNRDAFKRIGEGARRAVRVLAAVIQTGSDRPYDDIENHVTVRAGKHAYEMAGVGPRDVSVAEVHDATAVGEILQIENLGFCSFGDGGPISERGETEIGGRIPVNPSGGLESKGHPVGATGLAQIHELVTQLRGESGARQVENARIAVAENGGGTYGVEEAVACVTILGR